MDKRILYTMLFAIPGFFISLLIAFLFFGAVYGFFWIYYFGDNLWPYSSERIFPILFVTVFLTAWFIFIITGYMTGKRLENRSVSDRKHILISTGITIMSILLIIFHQLNVGNIGSESDSIRCSDYCMQEGYSSSGMPAKNTGDNSCSCYDNSGQEVIRIPVGSIDSAQ